MSSLLSAISGKFSSAVILGTFFPVTVFVFLARVLWVPLLPPGYRPTILVPLAGLDDKWELFVLTLAAIVVSGLLYNLNTSILRIYEGYPWKDTLVGRWMVERKRRVLRVLEAQKSGLYPLRQSLLKEGKRLKVTHPASSRISVLRRWIDAARAQEGSARRDAFSLYPKMASVLPTRFGNAVRSFENYAEEQYGMAGITLWPRLVAVIEPGYAEVIDTAKTGVDFLINSSLLSGLLSLLLLATGLVYPSPERTLGSFAVWLFEIALFLFISWWMYRDAISGALEWGNGVRGAFDLYRGKLLEKLGYARAPESADEEKALWNAISSRLVAGDPPEGVEIPPYVRKPPAATTGSCTPGAALEITRGVMLLADGAFRIVLRVHNATDGAVADLRVTDAVPEGFFYVWDSAAVGDGTVEVSGINPYIFLSSLKLAAGASRRFEYTIVPRSKPS